MPTHVVLGATGGTGSAILRCLLTSKIPDLHINILVRSKGKLLQAFPQLESTSSATISIFEGSISNGDVLRACLQHAETIYVCVATNHASRKVEVAVTTAASLVAALGHLRETNPPEYQLPVILFNRSLSLNSDAQLPIPGFVKKFTVFALWLIYEDLLKAGTIYEKAEKDGLLTCITADPPGLMDPERTEPTGYKFLVRGKTSATINYADLGAAMVELGQRRKEFEGTTIAISATGAVRVDVLSNLLIIFLGLKSRLSPF
ncbi:hypothetical protein LTR86_008126 [Recurvomyces mirabilis]|nr:hypothetical protein LTR86_008126 [Recurvomyces mirabilis]